MYIYILTGSKRVILASVGLAQARPNQVGCQTILTKSWTAKPFEQPRMRFMYIIFTQEVRTRVTSSQHGWSNLNQWYFELKASRKPQGTGRSGLCCKVAEHIFQADQVEISWNTAFLTEGKTGLLQLCGSEEVWEATSDAQLTPGRDFLCQCMSSGWWKAS